jgi:hypothetical protein
MGMTHGNNRGCDVQSFRNAKTNSKLPLTCLERYLKTYYGGCYNTILISETSRPARWLTKPPLGWIPGFNSPGKSGSILKLTVFIQTQAKSGMIEAISLTNPSCYHDVKRDKFTFIVIYITL